MNIRYALIVALTAVLTLCVMNVGAQDPDPDRRPDPKKVGRADRVKDRNRNMGPAVDPAALPTWDNDPASALERAASLGKSLVIVFLDESDAQQAEGYISGKEIAQLSENEAVFIRVTYTKDRAPSPDAPQNIVPVCKLTSDNSSRDYKVVSYPTVVVADQYANEVSRFTKVPSAAELKAAVGKVGAHLDAAAKRLQKNLDAAKKAWENKDYGKTLKSLEKNFKEGLVGIDPQAQGIILYNEMLEAARAEVAELANDPEGGKRLTELKNAFKSVDKGFSKEIEETMKKNSR